MNEMGGWRYIHASVPGVAHRASGADCQDACAARLLTAPDADPVLLLVAADGAGSATQARAGAELACQTLLAALEERFSQPLSLQDWTRSEGEALLQRVQTALAQRAAEVGLPVREFACTLLSAAIAADYALLLQIGDGAIVIGAADGYQPAFWPQAGEYANETYFVTDPNAAARLEFAVLAEPVAEIALLTDGLQMLALHYQTRQAHAPFFRPLFQRLREYPDEGCSAALVTALERFLDGPAINQRTHDDKTLILASRVLALAVDGALQPEEMPLTTTPPPAVRVSTLVTTDTHSVASVETMSPADAFATAEPDASADNSEVSCTDATDVCLTPTASTSETRELHRDEAV